VRDLATELRCVLGEAKLDRKGDRYKGNFYGNNDGTWVYKETQIGELGRWDWGGTLGLSSKNNWKNIYMDKTTEDNPAFLKALREMVKKYPELKDFLVAFDGPLVRVSDLLRKKVERDINWSKVVFYHGTSMAAWEKIQRQGLVPRRVSGTKAAYGVAFSAAPGHEDAIYLTTQENTTLFAARDAARGTGSNPVVLKIVGIDGKYVAPDEDSRETTAAASYRKMGSIAYLGKISPRKISLYKEFDGKRWFKEGYDESVLVGVKEFPALIVHDDEALGTTEAITRYHAIVQSHLDIVRQHKGWAQKTKDQQERHAHLGAAKLHQMAADAYDKLQDDNKGVLAAKRLRIIALKATRALMREDLAEAFEKMTLATFDPELFIGQWFLSKKPADPRLYEMLAKKYPFRGRAWRLDTSAYDGPYASWCGTLEGIRAWKDTQDPSGFGRTPNDWHIYVGTITNGIDLTKLVKGEKLTGDRAGKRIMDMSEVVPIKKVKNVTQVYGT